MLRARTKTRGRAFLLKINENDTFFRILFGHVKTFYYLCAKFEYRRYGRGLGAYGESGPKKRTKHD